MGIVHFLALFTVFLHINYCFMYTNLDVSSGPFITSSEVIRRRVKCCNKCLRNASALSSVNQFLSYYGPHPHGVKTTDSLEKNYDYKTYVRDVFDKYRDAVEEFGKKFYLITFTRLLEKNMELHNKNGISFVQSGVLLYIALMLLSLGVDDSTKKEMEQNLMFSNDERRMIKVIRKALLHLPESDSEFKFRWSTRLVHHENWKVPRKFEETARSMKLHLSSIGTNASLAELKTTLNDMMQLDSGGVMRDTIDDEDISQGVNGMLISTLYMRGEWRSAPTLLNGTRPFYTETVNGTSVRNVSMLRINDVVLYANLEQWDAEAVEIPYAREGLSLLVVMPRGGSLRPLVERLAAEPLHQVTQHLKPIRAAVQLPVYTLRMTILLPEKLKQMGIDRLFSKGDPTKLRLSHAIQRIMFWSEAGRNAYKDDGIEWDKPPNKMLSLNKPYAFYVRWNNMTLLNGHLVL